MRTSPQLPHNQLRLSLLLSLRLSLNLSVCLFAFLPFCLLGQNITIKKNANNDHLIWPLNTSQSIYIGDGSGNASTGIYNTAVGAYALNLNTSGASNTAFGNSVLAQVTSGGLNTAMGSNAMYGNTLGTENTAFGTFALYDNKGRSRSTAVGFKSMYYANSATSAGLTYNTAIGYEALRGSVNAVNNTGIKNTAVGDQAMNANTSGNSNSAFGFNALKSNTTGYSNVAIGTQTLFSNTSKSNLVAIGDSALYFNGVNASNAFHANYNTAIGSKALYANTTGYQNTAVGTNAMANNQVGSENTALGYVAGYNSQGNGNIYIGSFSGYGQTGSNKLFISNSFANYAIPLLYGEFDNQYIKANGRMEIFSNTNINVLDVKRTAPPGGLSNSAAIRGMNNVDVGYGTGVEGTGGAFGVVGLTNSTGPETYYGVAGNAYGSSTGENVGVLGEAHLSQENYGVRGMAVSAHQFNYYNVGVDAIAQNSAYDNVGVQAVASGPGGNCWGGSFEATGQFQNYGISASASGGTENLAAYFAQGNVLIDNKLSIGKDPTVFQVAIRHGGYGLQIQHASAGTSYWELYQNSAPNGNLLFYTETGVSVANINYTSGAYSATSDRRLKENIQPMNSVLQDVMKLQASQYSYKADTDHKPCIGFIAQDVEPLFPQIVTPPTMDGERESNYTMDYSGFGVLAIKAIQEQQAIIDSQEERIAKLEALVNTLMAGKQ